MCYENYVGKFTVQLSAGMGWWIGEVLGVDSRFLRIYTIWIENSEYSGDEIVYATPKFLKVFDGEEEAMKCVQAKLDTTNFSLTKVG